MSAYWLRWLVLALCSAVLGCATITQNDSEEEHESAPAHRLTNQDLTGVWEGFLVAYCAPGALERFRCYGVGDIRFTIVPDEVSSLAGSYAYTCTMGPESCGNRSTVGAIEKIGINGMRVWLRVMLPDGSSCLFTSPFHPTWMKGGYECWDPMEQGRWQAKRAF